MKIGIMSMQRIENYGSFLQAFCLKQLLEELNQEVLFIDYIIEPCIVQEPEIVIKKRSISYKIVRKVYYFFKDIYFSLNGKKERDKKIESMRLRNLYSHYIKELGISEKRNENKNLDLLIIGSDEVFNCLQTNQAVGYSKQLFGEYINADRIISYAASAGFTTLSGLEKYGIKDEVANMLQNNFDCISVRDNNTYDLVTSLTNKEPIMHLDPVLIGELSNKIIEKKDLKNYVVIYSYEERMSDKKDEKEAIQKFAHKRGLKTVSIGNFQKWTDLKIEANPFELLGYIKNADYVITDTFHGTIFSIILHKKFTTIIRNSNKQKLTALLEMFALENRILNKLSDIEKIIDLPIDYDYVDKVRKRERKRAIKYLSDYLD